MIQRGGPVVLRMPADVKRRAIGPLIKATVAPGAVVDTDGYDVCARLAQWGYPHHAACHAAGEFARDDGGDGSCEVHVNTPEGFWVAAAVVAEAASRGLPGAVAVVPGILRVRARRPETGQGAVGVIDRATGSTPESRMSQI